MALNTILEKVDYLLCSASHKIDIDLNTIISLTLDEHKSGSLGKVFGYNVFEYAIATLKWLGYEDEFQKVFSSHDDVSQTRIMTLIDSKMYLQY